VIKLFSTHCPKCKILTKKLQEYNIEFEEENNVDSMLSIGITTVPMLNVDGVMMDFSQAIQWLNTKTKGDK